MLFLGFSFLSGTIIKLQIKCYQSVLGFDYTKNIIINFFIQLNS